ncbi:N-acetyltransferase [Buttiauxella sp. WJP83]|uniref:N-acetyltransferase n=1 Tax=Buttiauxella sp. WJP83 TaxID=2986951 RepID=UPI0022DD4EDB|nr:N-acetyltransferase [Buttiauxella sp. WJP83]WBM70816.1 N-acetyltransferase [Buttiauxella sp. WJP83]
MSEIVVRHAEINDAQALQQIYAQPALYRDTLHIPHPALALFTERVTELKPGSRNLVACIDEKVVGQLMLAVEQNPRRSHVATFGIGVDSNYQGRGVATALLAAMTDLCDNWLRIERIELTVFVDNEPGVAVYRKFGFEIEGTGKNYALRDGQYVDAYFMARFKPTAK